MSHQEKKKFKSKYGQTKGGQINQRKRNIKVSMAKQKAAK